MNHTSPAAVRSVILFLKLGIMPAVVASLFRIPRLTRTRGVSLRYLYQSWLFMIISDNQLCFVAQQRVRHGVNMLMRSVLKSDATFHFMYYKMTLNRNTCCVMLTGELLTDRNVNILVCKYMIYPCVLTWFGLPHAVFMRCFFC